ncbi:MAG TPA: nitrilase family protein [Chitinophagaceae bacterium]|nr:nitrilase family protein [Chitinophagaceae bacterium]
MEKISVATAQFEHKSNDKEYNLSIIDNLSKRAASEGARMIAFHECSVTGYTFARHLSRRQLLELAEMIPGGNSIGALTQIAKKNNIAILAGLFEKDIDDNLFKAYVCVDKDGCIAKHRKLHPFINPHLKAGDQYTVFEFEGWKCGILICYDNNVIENVRATALLGAKMIFMPHVTMCTPSTRPGAGFVDAALWKNKNNDPIALRKEFDGPKGKEWLMKWLPARAHDNGVYVIFSNPIGMDDDQVKNGCSMIIDPFGDVIAECRALNDEFVIGELGPEKLTSAGGFRYTQARRPDLYKDIIGRAHTPELKISWLHHD